MKSPLEELFVLEISQDKQGYFVVGFSTFHREIFAIGKTDHEAIYRFRAEKVPLLEKLLDKNKQYDKGYFIEPEYSTDW